MLTGLFPPSGDQIWNEDLAWQPIPVHAIPEAEDYFLVATKQCDRFDYFLTDNLNQNDTFNLD